MCQFLCQFPCQLFAHCLYIVADSQQCYSVGRILWGFPAFVLRLRRKQQRRRTSRYRGICEKSGLSRTLFRDISCKPQRRQTSQLLVPSCFSAVFRSAFPVFHAGLNAAKHSGRLSLPVSPGFPGFPSAVFLSSQKATKQQQFKVTIFGGQKSRFRRFCHQNQPILSCFIGCNISK